MVTQMLLVTAIPENRFDLRHIAPGWVDVEEDNPLDKTFCTGDFLPVQAGDRLYFGPAVITQWWHLIAYDRTGQPIKRGMLDEGVTICQRLDAETAILCYEVSEGEHAVRMIADVRYHSEFVVLKNHPFSSEEFRRWMKTSEGKVHRLRLWLPDRWVLLMLSGSGTLRLGEQTLSLSPHQLVVAPPQTAIFADSEEGFFGIGICAESFSPLTDQETPLVVADDEDGSVELLMGIMRRRYWASAAYDRPLLETLYATVEQLVRSRIEEERPQYSGVTYLHNALLLGFSDPDFSLEEVLNRGHYCPNHLRRLFKEQMGCSPREYLMRLRIHHAQNLLCEQGPFAHSVAQIAQMAGFRDPCYFSRVFTRYVGVTPLAYGKAHRR